MIEGYYIVELMGHVRHVGFLVEVDLLGGKMGKVDAMQRDGTVITKYFTAASVYQLTPTDEETCRRMVMPYGESPYRALAASYEEEIPTAADNELLRWAKGLMPQKVEGSGPVTATVYLSQATYFELLRAGRQEARSIKVGEIHFVDAPRPDENGVILRFSCDPSIPSPYDMESSSTWRDTSAYSAEECAKEATIEGDCPCCRGSGYDPFADGPGGCDTCLGTGKVRA